MDVAPPERLLDVAGMNVLVCTSTAEDLALLSKVLGERRADPDASKPVVKLVLGNDGPPAPRRKPDYAGPYGDHWVGADTAHFLHHWGLSARIGCDSVWLGGPAEGYRRWVAVRNSMLFVLAHLYMHRGRYLLHSAALHLDATACGTAETLLVVADSGRGKSTLTYAALLAGMSVMGDDMVVVTPNEAGITAQGVPRVLTVPADVFVGEFDSASVLPEDDRRRVELEGHDLHPEAEVVSTVVLCDHDTGDGHVTGIDATDAIEQLAAAFVLSALSEPMRRWFPIAARLANGPRVALLHAADPAKRVERAIAMLHEVTQQAHATPHADSHPHRPSSHT